MTRGTLPPGRLTQPKWELLAAMPLNAAEGFLHPVGPGYHKNQEENTSEQERESPTMAPRTFSLQKQYETNVHSVTKMSGVGAPGHILITSIQ